MARFQDFAKELRLATAGISQDAISAELAKFARAQLAEAIGSGAGSPMYSRFVNGREGAAEETVEAPGPILYVFAWWAPVIGFALAYARGRSPERSGRYRKSWIVLVNGREVDEDAAIPAGAEVTITNRQPYHRKIDSGHMRMRVPPGIIEEMRSRIARRFSGAVEARATQVLIPGGYILKGKFRRGYRERARSGLRRDTRAGQPMTYPAVVMRMKAYG